MNCATVKTIIRDIGRSELERLLGQYDEDVLQAAIDCDVQPEDIEEAYQGAFDSDEAFVQDLLEQTDGLPKDLPSYIHINWERTARDIMMDYSESNGHYFRCL